MKYSLFLLLILTSCTGTNTKKDGEWKLPKNELPSIFTVLESYDVSVYKTEIIPESLVFGCIERNDYPHYWCDFEAKLKYPDPKHPDQISAIFMSSQPMVIVEKYKAAIKNFKKSKSRLFLLVVYREGPHIIDGKETLLFSYVSLYNKETCINWYNYSEDCPKGSEFVLF